MLCIYDLHLRNRLHVSFQNISSQMNPFKDYDCVRHICTASLDVYERENTKCTIFNPILLIIFPPKNILVLQVCIQLGKNLRKFNGMWKHRAISALPGSQNLNQSIFIRFALHFLSLIVSVEIVFCKSISNGIKILKII